jgi:hypothetical protein
MLPGATPSENAVMMRVLLCGFCLTAVPLIGAPAQTLSSAVDLPVAATPLAPDEMAMLVNSIPEVIRQDDVPATPEVASAPAGVLTPPTVDRWFLRAISSGQGGAASPR